MAIKRTNLGSGAVAVPPLRSGHYFYTGSPGAISASAAIGINVLRVIPWMVHQTVSITRLGAEITISGDVGSKVRLGIYRDTGESYPGALLIDAGQINGDSVAVQELTISQELTPGLYWVGGVVQAVTTTQPSARVVANFVPPVALSSGATLPPTNQVTVGYQHSSVTGALPGVFTTTVGGSSNNVRTFVRTA